jgi:hypothetical protein
MRWAATVVAALILVLIGPTARAQGERVVITEADGGKVVHVVVGDTVHVQLAAGAPSGPCARGWGPITGSNERVLVLTAHASADGDATADFRANGTGTAHIGAAMGYLPGSTGPGVACPAIQIAWQGVTVVVGSTARGDAGLTGGEIAALCAVAVVAIAAGLVARRSSRRAARSS